MAKKQQILNTFLELVASGGLNDCSMRDLSAKSGVSIGAIYNYFPGKDDLLRGLFAEWQERRAAAILDNDDLEASTEDRLKNYWSNLFGFYTGFELAFNFLEQFISSPLYSDVEREKDRELLDPVVTMFERGIANGDLRYMHPLSILFILFGHASSCARLHLSQQVEIADYQQDVVRQSCWDSMRPMKY